MTVPTIFKNQSDGLLFFFELSNYIFSPHIFKSPYDSVILIPKGT